jgi:cytoskeleton protein RodZ
VASFGTRLRLEREQRGITLDQISRSTKIGTRFLQALEQDRFEQLPGGIFNKGFIRAYARFLGLNEEQTLADYLAATSPGEPAPVASETAVATAASPKIVGAQAESERATTSLPWGTFAMLLLVVALSFAIWGFYTREREPSTPVKHPVAPTTNSTGSTAPPANSPASDSQMPASEGQAGESQKPPSEVQTAPPEVPADSSPHPAPTGSASPADSLGLTKAEPESSSTKAPVSAASLVTASFTVHLKARKDAWVSITADGRKLSEETLSGGAEKSIRAANQIIVRTGNAGALDLEFNGQKLPTQGTYGEVKTLEFGPSGLEVTVSNSPRTDTP